MKIRRPLTITGVAVVATVALVVPALAFWGANSNGAVPANATALAPATSVSASATGSTTATVTWTNGANPIGTTYTVTAGSTTYCSGSTSTSSPCSVTGLTAGASYTFAVTPVLQGWTGTSASAAQITTQKVGTSLTVAAPGSGTVNTAIAASTISASLSGGTSPTGSISFTVFGPQSSAPTTCTSGGTAVGTGVTVSGNGSYHPSAGFTPTTAGNYWWFASYGGDTQNAATASTCGSGMAETVVSSGATPTFELTPATGPETAGVAFNVTVQAKLGASNDTSYTGTHTLTISAPTAPDGTHSATLATTSVTFNSSGSATVSATLFKAIASNTFTIADTSPTTRSGETSVAVNSGGAALSFTTAPTSLSGSGTTWTSTVTIAHDAWNNAPLYAGSGISISITLSGTNANKFSVAPSSVSATGTPSGSFTVTHTDAASKSATVTASTSAPGFTAADNATATISS